MRSADLEQKAPQNSLDNIFWLTLGIPDVLSLHFGILLTVALRLSVTS